MAEITTATYAVAGTGEVDEGNAARLLDDLLPQKLGAVYRPARVPRSNKALSFVISWLESDDVLGPKGTVPSDDLTAALIARRTDGDDVTLIVLWPAEPSEEDLKLVRDAFDAEIPVKNLSAALDDLLQDDVFPPSGEGEATGDAPSAESIADAVTEKVRASLGGDFGAQLATLLERFVRDVVVDELALRFIVVTAPASVAPKEAVDKVAARLSGKGNDAADTDVPPFEGPYTPVAATFKSEAVIGGGDAEERVAYYMDEDGKYRRAKSRPRRGETRVMLTLEEVDQAARKELITDS